MLRKINNRILWEVRCDDDVCEYAERVSANTVADVLSQVVASGWSIGRYARSFAYFCPSCTKRRKAERVPVPLEKVKGGKYPNTYKHTTPGPGFKKKA